MQTHLKPGPLTASPQGALHRNSAAPAFLNVPALQPWLKTPVAELS